MFSIGCAFAARIRDAVEVLDAILVIVIPGHWHLRVVRNIVWTGEGEIAVGPLSQVNRVRVNRRCEIELYRGELSVGV